MLIIRIEIWPFGNKDNARLLGICKIANDGTGNQQFGNYDVELSHAGKYIDKPGVWKEGRVEHHKRSQSPYHLVYKAIKTCLWPKKK